jgi:hypothetical protein
LAITPLDEFLHYIPLMVGDFLGGLHYEFIGLVFWKPFLTTAMRYLKKKVHEYKPKFNNKHYLQRIINGLYTTYLA